MKPPGKLYHAVKEPEINVTQAPQDGDVLLPHERDEAPDPEIRDGSETTGSREVIEQAARDIKRGLRDTDQHGIPSDVPGPGLDPETTPGADVPENGAPEAAKQRDGKRT